MFKKLRRDHRLRKLKPGDGSRLKDYRFWQLFSRSLFFIELADASGRPQVYAVDVHYFADASDDESLSLSSAYPASLYRDGVQEHRSDVPAAFPVPGGVIEVATSMYGLTRMHYVTDDGQERALQPHRSSQEGLRARFGRRHPRASALIGIMAIIVLLVGLVFGIPQVAELVTHIDPVAERVGTFTSPFQLPEWANITLLAAGMVAAMERALTLRNHWLIDADTTWASLG